MHEAAEFCTWFALAILAFAAAHDMAVRTVPNTVVGAVVLCAIVVAVAEHRLLLSVAVATGLLVITCVFCLRGYCGGADAKLLSASALLVAPNDVFAMLLATALAGGLLCLPYIPGSRLIPRPAPGRPAVLAARLVRCEIWRLHRGGPLPYAVAIAAGAAFVLMHGS